MHRVSKNARLQINKIIALTEFNAPPTYLN